MSIAGYLYSAEIPSASGLLDTLIKTLVASEYDSLDSDTAQTITDGLLRAWIGAKEANIEDFDPEYLDNPEQVWIDTYQKIYLRMVQGKAPTKEEMENSDVGSWPEGLKLNRPWPRKALIKIVKVMAEIDADRTKAFYRYCQQEMSTCV